MKKRNLSGIYILDRFGDDEKETPTCIEECREETLDKWLESLNKGALIRTVKHLAEVIKELGEVFNIENDPEREE